MYYIYLLISEDHTKTYIGFTDDINRRVKEHKRGITKTTRNFGKFTIHKIETVNSIKEAREREKYYKSHSGRKRLKLFFN